MAFTTPPVFEKVTDRLWRITDAFLAANATGTIGFSDKTAPAEVGLVAPDWQPYEYDGPISLQDAVAVRVRSTDAPFNFVTPVSVVKTGSTHADFQIAIHNDNAPAGQVTPNLEIYVEWVGH
jgi:hypothetical protein